MPGLISATVQDIKLKRAGYALFAGVAVIGLAKILGDGTSLTVQLFMAAVGAALIAGGAFYAIGTVRCPSCRLAWVRWSLGNQPHTQWLQWLYQFTACPKCGYSDGPSVRS